MFESRDPRVERLLTALGEMAGGDLSQRIAISDAHDEVDAIAFGINALCDELGFTTAYLHRLKEAAEAANEQKTLFIRDLSHEIRTPLAAILGLAQLSAQPDVAPARRDELWQRIEKNGAALHDLLDDLLDLSKIEAGRVTFAVVPFELTALAAEVIASFEPEAIRKSLSTSVVAPRDLPLALADPKRVRQVLMNVVGNAVKFTSAGAVTVTLGRDRGALFVDVTDSGIGMSPGHEQQLFEAWAQGDSSIERSFGGSGLGLMLSRRLAEGMEGSLEVLATARDRGTTLRLRLPIATASLAPATAPVRSNMTSRPPTPRPLHGLRLLLVEDDVDIREAMVELLRLAGADVSEADDGDVALARVAADVAFDAVLMDIRMPRLDGLSATRALRARGVTLPILILTADAVDERRVESLAAGGTAWISKPVDLRKLIELLDRLVPRA